MKSATRLTGIALLLVTLAGAASGEVLFRDDFNGTGLDTMRWAPGKGWADAFSGKLVPARNARQNQTSYDDVDYVEVRTIP